MPRSIDPNRLLYLAERSAWRDWLSRHYEIEPEVWLVAYRKDSGRPSLAYNDAVEEALCFGWIDSIIKKVDAERFAQRYSPRKKGSDYSQPNRERLRKLVAAGLVADAVLPSVMEILEAPFVPPSDILEALQADPTGWAHFMRCSDAYQRVRIAWVDAARRRPAEFDKRLRYLLRMNHANKQFGQGRDTYL